MLTRWAVSNFKSIDDRVELDLAPLTLLVGPNSSGKSTILQSILMVAQTLSSRRSEPQLLLNGELVRLGVLDDLLHVHRGSKAVPFKKKSYLGIGFELQPSNADTPYVGRIDYRPTRIEANIRFQSRAIEPDRSDERYPAVVRCDINVDSVGAEGQTTQALRSSIRITTRKTATDIRRTLPDQEMARQLPGLSLRPRMSGKYAGATRGGCFRRPIRIAGSQTRDPRRVPRQTARLQPIGTQLRRFLPTQLIALYDSREIELRNYIDELLMNVLRPKRGERSLQSGHAELADFINTYHAKMKEFSVPTDHLNDWVRRLGAVARRKLHFMLSDSSEEWLQKRLAQSEPQLQPITVPMPEPFETAVDVISHFFSQGITYLGPLREEPRLLYAPPFSGDPTDVGLKGEYTAAVLTGNRNVQVSYCDPTTKRTVQAPLKGAVNHWLRHFGLADSVETREVSKLGHGLVLVEDSIPQYLDLTNVGVGVSQVLPILVSGLLAKEGSLLIYEQPEIHLHPKLQAELADFFLGLILCGKRCIVETHSEYLMHRIRLRLAEAQDKKISSNVRMFFSERVDSVSRFREVLINEYGAVTDWPKGFFDQAQEEAQLIIEASMRKRQQGQHGRPAH